MSDRDKTAISRRKALRATAIAGAAATGAAVVASVVGASGRDPAIGGGAAGGRRGSTRELKLVTTWPKNFPGLGTGAERLARRIEALSDGAIRVRLYAAGELVPALGAFDAVAQGKADLYHGAEYYWQGKSPAFNFFAAVPFGMTASEMNAWVRFGGGQALWDELAAPFNVKPFMAGNTGTQMGGWYKREINTLDDFRGLRIRMPGLGGEVMSRLGATPVTKPGGELFQALDQGNIDASEWVGPWNDVAFGFHTIVKTYYYPGIHEPGTTLSVGVNARLWAALSPSEQAVVEAAAAAENDIMKAEFDAENARALAQLMQDPTVKLQRFSDDILTRKAEIAAELLAQAAADDALTGRVYDSFIAARGAADRWGAVAERAFVAARALMTTS